MSSQDERLRELIAEQAAEWYVAHQEAGLDEARKQAFMRWLRTSPVHVAEYLSVAGIARDMAGAARQAPDSLEQLLAGAGAGDVVALDGSVIGPPDAGAGGAPARRRMAGRMTIVRHAAFAATALLVAGAALWLAAAYDPHEYVTRHGEQRTWQLPDDTVVRLNSNSAIDVDFNAERRTVSVERGQVFFEIAPDAGRPFNVHAGSLRIEDIGTAFDVYRQEEATTVTVVEGRVRIWDREQPAAPATTKAAARAGPALEPSPVADLEAGIQVRLAKSGRVERRGPVDTQQATAWIRERIVFEKDPIAEVAAEFNRYNRRQIHIDDPQVGDIPISGVFRTYDVDSFVEFLSKLPGVRVEETGNRVVVTREPASPSRAG